jgi:predicted transcriptional regulator
MTQLTQEQLIAAINKAAEEGDEATVHELGRLIPRQGPSVMDPKIPQAEAAALGAAQGVTFGFSDELYGLAGGDSGAARDRLAMAREQHPWTAFGSEIAGGVGTGFGTIRGLGTGLNALRASNTARRVSYPAFAGAEGALYGAGAAQPGDRVSGALGGAGLGVAAGVAVPAASAALQWTGRKVSRAFSSGDAVARQKAMEAIQEVAQREGTSADDVLRFLQEDDTRVLADYSDRYLGQARHSTARAPAETRELIQKNMRARTRSQAGVLEQEVDDLIGVGNTSYREELAKLQERATQMGRQEYDELFRGEGAQGVAVPDWLRARLKKSVTLSRAWNEAEEVMAARGDVLPGNAARLHRMKVYLSGKARQQGLDPTTAAAYKQNAAEIGRYLDETIQGYADISARRADIYAIEEAAEAGRRLLTGRMDFEDVADLGQLQGERSRAFIVGTRDALRQLIRDNPGKDPSKLIPPGRWNRLRSTLGDEVTDELDTVLQYEGRLWRTADALERVTADLTREAPAINRADASAGALGKVGLFLTGMAEALRRNADKLSTREHDHIARVLAQPLSKDPAARAKELEIIKQALTPIYRNHFGAAGAAGAAAGGIPGMLADPPARNNGILEE